MQAGRIVEQGNQRALLELESGLYRRLYNLQFRGQPGDTDIVIEDEWVN